MKSDTVNYRYEYVDCPICQGHGQTRSYDGATFGWNICVWCDGYGKIKKPIPYNR